MLDQKEGGIIRVLWEKAGKSQTKPQTLLEAPGTAPRLENVCSGTPGSAHTGDVCEEFTPDSQKIGAGRVELFAEAGQQVAKECLTSFPRLAGFYRLLEPCGITSGRGINQMISP